MRSAGADLVVDAKEVAVVGLTEVVKHLPSIRSRFHKLLRQVDEREPALAILIDFPDFNLRLAKQLHRRGIPVVHFVSPQLWAWRTSRVKQIEKYIKKMLVIFPFETEFYAKHKVDATYVGHPLADLPAPSTTRTEYAKRYGLDQLKPWIALLPGSREGEIRRHVGALWLAALKLGEQFEYLLPRASTISAERLDVLIKESQSVKLNVPLHVVHDARTALAHSRAAVVASGTATVEAALIGTPFVVVYRVAPLTWKLGRRMVKLSIFAMPNLIAGRTVVPELIQSDFTAEKVIAELSKIIPDGPARSTMLAGLADVRAKLHPSAKPAADKAAEEVLKLLPAAG